MIAALPLAIKCRSRPHDALLSATSFSPTHFEMTTPYLPPELVEHIIDMLVGDRQSLLSCSLASVNWVHRSRHHLFASIRLHSLSNLQSWFSTGLGPCSHHVRTLHLVQDEFKWITPETLEKTQSGLSSFYNVKSLSITNLNLATYDEGSLARFFGHFSNLTSLSVEKFTGHPDALVYFICMFPELDNLKIDSLTMVKTAKAFPSPTVTPRFRGKFSLSNLKTNGTAMVTPLMALPMAFEDVCVEYCRFETPKPVRDLFVACQRTMKKIKVRKIYFGKFRP
jgi:hypothetical protein